MTITNDIRYVGVNDRDIDLFEGQYVVPNGMAYNSYVILDEKIAVMDSVDAAFGDEWLANIKALLGERVPDYLVVHHMEPDHSANITAFVNAYPDAKIVSSKKAFDMMKGFFGTAFGDRQVVVGNGSELSLGKHTLTFLTAPMVHWPEVIVSYDSWDRVLFSADGFGKFGALDTDEDWACEARRYYFGIVGKYGDQVQLLLKKAAELDIRIICPLHGPVLFEDLSYYLGLYDTWSSYRPEDEGILIAYTSVYGNTKKAVLSSRTSFSSLVQRRSPSPTLQETIWQRLLRMHSATQSLFSQQPPTTAISSPLCVRLSTISQSAITRTAPLLSLKTEAGRLLPQR